LHPACTIIVVAAHEGLRRSLAFALEAEGYAVVTARRPSDIAASSQLAGVACIVVDEETVAGSGAWDTLVRMGPPLVLLSDGVRQAPAVLGARTVTKPLLGRSLIDTVASSVRGCARAPVT
jgi:DNA-binding response OmpR family regulator